MQHQEDASQQLQKQEEESTPLPLPVTLPLPMQYRSGQPMSVEWAEQLAEQLDAASWQGLAATARVLPAPSLVALLRDASKAWQPKQPLLEVTPPEGASAVVVGDTHGQFHDVRHMFDIVGHPSPSMQYIFNGGVGHVFLHILPFFALWAPPHSHLRRKVYVCVRGSCANFAGVAHGDLIRLKTGSE